MIPYREVIKKALKCLAEKEKYAYFYGAKGFILTDYTMNKLIAQYKDYFSKYSAEKLEEIKDYSRGKIGYDCSGFITYLTGDGGYSGAQWNNCNYKTNDLSAGIAGSILYKQGHIGIDIGYGVFIHFPEELHSAECCLIKDYNWTGSGLHKNIDYTGSDNL